MLDQKFVRDNLEAVIQNCDLKNVHIDLEEYSTKEQRRREIIQSTQELRNKRNTVSQEIALAKKNGQNADAIIADMRSVATQIKEEEVELKEIEDYLQDILLHIPNMLHESVPHGKTEDENIEIRRHGDTTVNVEGVDHVELCSRHKLVDFARAAKISGSGFAVYTGKGAQLERALINYMLDYNRDAGYTEVMTPQLVNTEAMTGTGQLPKFEEDLYKCAHDDLYLIPTAEVSITNLHAQETLSFDQVPTRYTGFSSCFRREAGSYGKETRGLHRLHQFHKVELVSFTRPEESYDELERMVSHVESLLKSLNIPYRVILLCSGDTTFGSAKTYDIEAWSPIEQRWLEISSCSNLTDYQARRAGIRYKPQSNSKPEFVHTLNGSSLATPRLMISLLENNQKSFGIEIPEVLHSYISFKEV